MWDVTSLLGKWPELVPKIQMFSLDIAGLRRLSIQLVLNAIVNNSQSQEFHLANHVAHYSSAIYEYFLDCVYQPCM